VQERAQNIPLISKITSQICLTAEYMLGNGRDRSEDIVKRYTKYTLSKAETT